MESTQQRRPPRRKRESPQSTRSHRPQRSEGHRHPLLPLPLASGRDPAQRRLLLLTATHVDVTVAYGYNVNSGAKLVGDADPVALCEQSWKAGTIGQAKIPADPNTANFPVPALQFCTLRTGIIAGFPTDDTSFCDNVCLSTWLP